MLQSNPLEAIFGGGVDFGAQGAQVKIPIGKRAISIAPSSGATTAILPNARKLLYTGLNRFCVWNRSPTNNLALRDFDNTLLTSLSPNEITRCHLIENGTQAGTWILSGSAGIIPNVDWAVQIGALYWQMESNFSLKVGTVSGDKFVPLSPQAEPPSGKLVITTDGGDEDIPLVNL